MYIYQQKEWANFSWKSEDIIRSLSEVRNLQGRLIGKMDTLGFNFKTEALLETLTLDVLKSSEIEGEFLDLEQVRSSIAQRLGLEFATSVNSDRNADGMVEMMLDATHNCFAPLTKERLFDWHAGLFPMGRSGIFRITVADWRKDTTGAMQVVSGGAGREKCISKLPMQFLLKVKWKTS